MKMNKWVKLAILAVVTMILTFSFLKAIIIGIVAFFLIKE